MQKKLLQKIFSWYFTQGALPYWCILLLDCFMVMASGYLGMYLVMGGLDFATSFWPITWGLLISLVLFMVSFRIFHTYVVIIRYSSFVDLQRLASAMLCGCVMTLMVSVWLRQLEVTAVIMPDLLCVCTIFFVATVMTTLVRVVVKRLFDVCRADEKTRKAFIFGVKMGGVNIAKSIQNQTPQEYVLTGFICPDDDMQAKYLMGVKVYPIDDDLISRMKEMDAKVVFVSPLQVTKFRANQKLINDLIANDIHIMMYQEAEEWDGTSDLKSERSHEVQIEDLLPRDKIEVDMQAIEEQLKGQRILITGAAGSIGSEMVRQVARFHPAEMVLIDQAETPMHDIRLLMARQYPEVKAWTIVASITNQEYMEKIFAEHRPDYVFHAAAYKHVPMMEDNPAMAVQNNIYGTRVIADLAVKYGTRKFVMISTDKAVNPTNVMGCSKRICEIYCQSLNAYVNREGQGTQFVTTRFGNVLGSNGSVIPIFKEQIAKGGPVTVTHPDIIRFFMLIPEACKLVLEAGTMGKGGEIFVFDMGKPVKIVDLARRMISLSGAKNIEIKFTGLREGEKLYEEVLSDKENTMPTPHPKIMVARVREYDYQTALANEERLMEVSRTFDDMAIVKVMKEIVPEYKSQSSKYQVLD